MFGTNIGTLSLDVFNGTNWINNVWSISGQQQSTQSNTYQNAEIDLNGYTVQQVRLRATASGGYRGDIAIDNLSIVRVNN